jgi:hypothetical protein
MRFCSVLAAAVLAAAATAQVAIPPHASVYNGYSRGFNFTAATAFFIVQLDLPLDAYQVGDTASYLVRVNGTTALWSIGNAGPITTNIQVNTGDVVDVIGNWTPVASGNFTAHNSYGNTTPFATTIEGVPHTLNRTGWQWDIGVPGWVATGTTGTYLAPTTGAMGRVLMYTSQNGGSGTLATNTALGQGCIRRYASFYENFATPAAFDLANTGITMVPAAGSYLVTSGAPFLPVGSVQSPPTALVLADDSEVTVPFTVGSFLGPNGPWTGVAVISNGVVSQAAGNSTIAAPAAATMLANPQTAFYTQGDWDPSATGGGTVWFEESAAVTTVTWDNVASWSVPGSTNTFQVQLFASGLVSIAWGAMAPTGANGGILVGYSPGGPNLDPGSTDVSALAGALLLDPADGPPLTLAGASRPVTNTTWNLSVTNIPAAGTLGIDVFGLSDPNVADLGFLGAPGCGARASLDVLSAWLVAGATHGYSLAIPNDPALVNFHVFTQSVVFQPGVNSLLGGVITSNGIDGKIGNL